MSKQTVLITGASTGIGRATALYFHEKGWNVIATMRNPENEVELYDLEDVLVTYLDVTELESIARAVKVGIEAFDKIDVVVNNAGYGAYGPLETFPRENIVRQFNTNVIGLLDVTKAILPHFRQNKNGTLINISSVGGKVTFPYGALYHGTKFAVEGITESLAFEMELIGCKAKIVEPGTIVTDFAGRSFDFQIDATIPEYQGMANAMMAALGDITTDESRAAPPIEVAKVIYQAATDGTDTLRYTAGYDAQAFLDAKASQSDEDYIRSVKQMFGL
ncbi:SDR family oxidoreductase [Vibrio sp. JC009]|uniref:SDR family oxidoreductase n=1 Tax=Vibrio sp. JC009 TaxID=2912314 RepID=UPI0023B0FD23|nr:SDR family oxidoreductase [Vibrio sp. JC009]WED23221.1 SDR family oxidoreductase [Vibrio sp. JC009]